MIDTIQRHLKPILYDTASLLLFACLSLPISLRSVCNRTLQQIYTTSNKTSHKIDLGLWFVEQLTLTSDLIAMFLLYHNGLTRKNGLPIDNFIPTVDSLLVNITLMIHY